MSVLDRINRQLDRVNDWLNRHGAPGAKLDQRVRDKQAATEQRWEHRAERWEQSTRDAGSKIRQAGDRIDQAGDATRKAGRRTSRSAWTWIVYVTLPLLALVLLVAFPPAGVVVAVVAVVAVWWLRRRRRRQDVSGRTGRAGGLGDSP